MLSNERSPSNGPSISQSVETEMSYFYDYFWQADRSLARFAAHQQLAGSVIDLSEGSPPADSFETTHMPALEYRELLGTIALSVFDETQPRLEEAFSFEPIHLSETAKYIGHHVVAISAQSRANQLHYYFGDRSTKKELLSNTGLRVPLFPRDYESPLHILTKQIVHEVPPGAAGNFYGSHVAAPAFDTMFSVAQIGLLERGDPIEAIRHALPSVVQSSTEDSMEQEQEALNIAVEKLIEKIEKGSVFNKVLQLFSRR